MLCYADSYLKKKPVDRIATSRFGLFNAGMAPYKSPALLRGLDGTALTDRNVSQEAAAALLFWYSGELPAAAVLPAAWRGQH